MNKSFDYLILKIIQTLITRTCDPFLSLFSLLGSFEVTTALLILIVAQSVQKRTSKFLVLGTYALGMTIELLGKRFIYHPGPPRSVFRTQLPFSIPSGFVHTAYSFPSGHSFRTVFLATLIWQLLWESSLSTQYKRLLSVFVVGFVFLMLLSRVSLGEHWPSDVLGGLGLGLILGWLARRLVPATK